MSAPPVPPFFEPFGRRPFAFFPAIQNVAHNKWFYRKSTWSEVLVENTRTHEEIWIPRRYLGELSRVDEPVMMVGLMLELELHAGRILPAERRVIEMPLAVNEGPRPRIQRPPAQGPAAVVGIRVESPAQSRMARFILGGISLGIVGCVLLVSFYRGGVLGNRIVYGLVTRSDLALASLDNYDSIVWRLGRPAEERWQSTGSGLQHGLLGYPRRGLYIILRGHDRSDAHYIGALDRNWNPVHSVELPGQGSSYWLLRALPRF